MASISPKSGVSEEATKEIESSAEEAPAASAASGEVNNNIRSNMDSDLDQLTDNALKVLEKRYLIRDENGVVTEKPEDMFKRVAHNIAEAERNYSRNAKVDEWADRFYSLMTSLKFLPNSPTLMNAGRDLQQLSACFVLPVEDSIDSIFEAIKHTALIHKSGGGTGFSFSRIRPHNDVVKTTKGVSSGPISFMTVFDTATETIKQGGTRRGANMGILRVDHPDIMEFIQCKHDNDKINNFNISVAVTDAFMDAVKKDGDYELVNPHTGKVVDKKNAREVFDRIVDSAWRNGEPGVVFIDRINELNPTPNVGLIESTNPCGEQPLLPYESCNLGSLNLELFVREHEGKTQIEWDDLGETVHTAVRFLDDVIDMNNYPIEKISEMTRSNRKIGLGIMGWANMLIRMGIPYDSEEALELADELMAFIQKEGRSASMELAKERGIFPNFAGSIYDTKLDIKLRNATITTIAPTGTISIIGNTSSGVEPLFAVTFVRNVMDNDKLVEVNPVFKKYAIQRGFYSEELMEKIAERGTVEGMEEVPEDVQAIFRTAHDITPEWHVRMQAAFQKYTDNAVSKTVNFPKSATRQDVSNVYWQAFDTGCKGITVYRNGSREGQVLSTGKTDTEVSGETAQGELAEVINMIKPRPRPATVWGSTRKVETSCGSLYVTINRDEKGLFEIFSQMGKTGGCAASQLEAISRLISLALRSGVEIESILKQLRGIRCPSPLVGRGGMVLSCPDALAKAVEAEVKGKRPDIIKEETTLDNFAEGGGSGSAPDGVKNMVGVCPDCGNAMVSVGGCQECVDPSCGYSKCG